jgi:N6-L-threonylcarbamoyladenine synthase
MGEDGTLLADRRLPLKVKPGKRGLAQSEMVYQHTRNLPVIFTEAVTMLSRPLEITAIGASIRPRPVEESFMPAFLVGAGYAKAIAASHGLAVQELSHQENHILAGIWSAGGPVSDRFIAVHVSGGTTEVTAVTAAGAGFKVELLGGSIDIAAGQFIDRVGVAIGLPFPAGSRLEKLAESSEQPAAVPVSVKDMAVSFAGPEAHCQRLLAKGEDSGAVARGAQRCVAESLTRIIGKASLATGIKEILLVGGVTANVFIRGYIADKLGRSGVQTFAPSKEFSSDNAIGSAFFALKSTQN